MTGMAVARRESADPFSRTAGETLEGPSELLLLRGVLISGWRRHTYMMMTFWEWLGQGYECGFVQALQFLLREGDEGHQTFIAETNRAFRTWIGTILRMGKFTDPR